MTENATTWIATEPGDPDILTTITEPVAAPGPGEVTIDVKAIGLNPADYKMFAANGPYPARDLPIRPGYEVAGVIAALGENTQIASGGGAVGDAVLAFRVATGGYTSALTLPASDVFAKPESLGFPEAANLLLAGSTAAEALDVTAVAAGDTVLVHGASGAVGVSVIQQAVLLGARVIGTAGEHSFDEVRRFGAEPVAYGEGLEDRVRALAPDGIDAAVDTVGTAEATDVSLALVDDRDRIVTIAAAPSAKEHGFKAIGGNLPASAEFRKQVRPRLIALAGEGKLVVPIARTYPFGEAIEALQFLKSGHPGGKLALIP